MLNQFRYKIKGDQFCQNNHDTRNPIKGDQLWQYDIYTKTSAHIISPHKQK